MIETFILDLTYQKFIFYIILISLLVIGLFVLIFRDLFFKSSFKYRILENQTPSKDRVLSFIRYPKYKETKKFSLRSLEKWYDDKFIEDKLVIVAGEGSPCVYGKEFIDKVYKAKEDGVIITMLAGPFFLKDKENKSYIIDAAQGNIINLYVANKRADRHFLANLYTGELYFEYPHEPNAKKRISVYFRENKYEVKQYLRKAKKLKKNSKSFNNCKINEDYLLLSYRELEILKSCIDLKGLKDFNQYTASEALNLLKKN